MDRAFSLPFMAQARRKEKTRIHNLPYGPSKRGLYIRCLLYGFVDYSGPGKERFDRCSRELEGCKATYEPGIDQSQNREKIQKRASSLNARTSLLSMARSDLTHGKRCKIFHTDCRSIIIPVVERFLSPTLISSHASAFAHRFLS